jgi:RNA polymerase sigma-70 factor (ECF subfamily)
MELENVLSSCLAGEESGEPSVLEQEVTSLFDSLRPPLLRYLSSFGLAAQDSEEVVQEVFLLLFLHLRDGKPRSNVRGWVYRVAHNLGLKRREKNHRALKLVVCSDGPFLESHLDSRPDPEAHLFFVQRKQHLMAIVEALPENDRRCLYLRAEGLRYREIAGIVGMSLGGVAFSLARSFARLTRVDGGVHV